VDYELNRPFTYLNQITEGQNPRNMISSGSDQICLGAPPQLAPFLRRSSPADSVSPRSEGFESPLVGPPIADVTAFLADLRFEHRDKLADLPLDLAKGDLP
jgi:hypothetical protein